MKFLYLYVDLFTIIIPLLFSFYPKINFYKTWRAFIPAIALVAIIFVVWDKIFFDRGIWNFNQRYISGFYLLGLPVEEILFFICVPYSCVFTYYCLDTFYDFSWNSKVESVFTIMFSLCLLLIGLIFRDRLYTLITFISTALICFFIVFISKDIGIGKVVTVYVILLIPFFMVNGILTGTGIEEPVVRYNNLETLNFRILTIPVEDFVYGFELFLLNTVIYNYFRSKAN
jgi:lycopene cyclase domain-containing protein